MERNLKNKNINYGNGIIFKGLVKEDLLPEKGTLKWSDQEYDYEMKGEFNFIDSKLRTKDTNKIEFKKINQEDLGIFEYKGGFRDNNFNGKAILTVHKGIMQYDFDFEENNGEFINGRMNGEGKLTIGFDTDNVKSGWMKDFICIWDNGRLQEISEELVDKKGEYIGSTENLTFDEWSTKVNDKKQFIKSSAVFEVDMNNGNLNEKLKYIVEEGIKNVKNREDSKLKISSFISNSGIK